jgi:hypothetical protein
VENSDNLAELIAGAKAIGELAITQAVLSDNSSAQDDQPIAAIEV